MYYIYCYTNKINQHKYIGQTNNIERRKREHLTSSFNPKSSSYNVLFHKKIREYGIDNFDFSILEILYEDKYANEKEKFWIEQKESYCGTGKGYNMDLGGSQRKEGLLSKEQLNCLKKEIKSGIPYIDLEEKYNVSVSFISSINNGVYFKDNNENYPLFKYYREDSDYDELIDLLLNSDYSLAKIATILNMGYSTVKKINEGKLRKGLYPNYPIRKKTSAQIKAEKIKDLLINTDISKKNIKEMIGVSDETIRRINLGITHKDNNLSYPLRNL